ncbi:MAG TPA: TIGR01777 family oxidoreductase [Abditibacteriaceae bacterium]|jgi:hypothetical protein
MKIVLAGGSGQIGQILARAFTADGHEVVVLSRGKQSILWRTVFWDAETLGDWEREIDGADAVINLAGRSVNCRYNAENRRDILNSRVKSTRILGAAITAAKTPPRVWLQSSTATIYAHRLDAPNGEDGILGGSEEDVPETWRFSIDVAKAWEAALTEAATPHTRKVALRSAMVMSADKGGVFDVLLSLVRRGLGGRAASGQQYVSWIHEVDFVRAMYFLLENNLSGAVNVCSPKPLPNAEFMAELRRAWGMPVGLPATKWMLEIGTLLMQSETELVLKSRRVVPQRLDEAGFEFQFRSWPEAADDLCARWRAQK